MAFGAARDLGEVGDREHLSPLGQAGEGIGDGMRRPAADAGVDLVEDQRLPAPDGGDRERDARELPTGGRLGDRRERQAGIRPDQKDGFVGAARARVALAQLDDELPLPHADPFEL